MNVSIWHWCSWALLATPISQCAYVWKCLTAKSEAINLNFHCEFLFFFYFWMLASDSTSIIGRNHLIIYCVKIEKNRKKRPVCISTKRVAFNVRACVYVWVGECVCLFNTYYYYYCYCCMPSDNGNNKHDNGHRSCVCARFSVSTLASFGQIHLLTRFSFERKDMGDKKRTNKKRGVCGR